MRACTKKQKEADETEEHTHTKSRVLDVNSNNDERKFPTNRVATTKYNLLTFFPRGLYEQFRRVANFYFLLVATLSLTPFSPVEPSTTFAPLAFVIGVSMLKEAFEDFKRWKQDLVQNNHVVDVLFEDGSFEKRKWADIRVGNIMKVNRDEALAADIVCLKTSTESGTAHIETKNLDGETNLKPKKALTETQKLENLADLHEEIECELPNNKMYVFSGAMTNGERDKISLNVDSLILRGSSLRNTEWVLGAVVYTGHETKIMKNSLQAPSKRSAIEKSMDWIVLFMLLLLFIMCSTAAIAFGINTHERYPDMWYLKPQIPSEAGAFEEGNPGQVGIFNFITTFVLLGYFIPISLYVSMEIIKLVQARLMNVDLAMYHRETDTPFVARTSNLNEELGMVTTVLSDKTGTLTQNTMEFFKVSIGGIAYGEGMTEVERTLARRSGQNVGAQQNRQPNEPGHNFRDSRIDDGAWKNQSNARKIHDFFLCLALCNTAIPEASSSEPSGVRYQCESPDESAFVIAARRFGLKLKRRETGYVILEEEGQERRFEVLEILEFTSNRKRMSVIVRSPDGKLLLFSKGADSVIKERLESAKGKDFEKTEKHLQEFSRGGLRTLVIAMRELNRQEFDSWRKEFQQANTAIHDRQDKVEEVQDKIERDLVLLGATAIEDKLQEGVPQAVEALAYAGIGIWVLTGDKLDTAINIAYACNLIREDMHQFVISIDNITARMQEEGDTAELRAEAQESVQQQLDHCTEEIQRIGDATKVALVIDGRALGHAMHKGMGDRLLNLSKQSGSIVCCRVSPLQKAMVTKMAKKGGLSTLAIGDGANDVGMIQTAHIGVGISGQEGMQAVMASDFALAQFRYLERLLVLHGRWNYRRIARFVTYFFYKNVVFGLTLFFYSTDTFFSSQRLYNDWHMAGFNVLFAALPIILVAIFDQDVSQQVSHENVYLYQTGTTGGGLGQLFTVRARAYWIVNGIYQAIILYYFIIHGMYRLESTESDGKVPGLHQAGVAVYTAVCLCINLQIMQMQTYWNWVMHLGWWLTVAIWFIALIVMSESLSVGFSRGQTKLIYTDVWGSPAYWLVQPVAIVLALLPDFTWRAYQRRFRPDPVDIVQEMYYQQWNCRCISRRDLEFGDRKPAHKKGLYRSIHHLLSGDAISIELQERKKGEEGEGKLHLDGVDG